MLLFQDIMVDVYKRQFLQFMELFLMKLLVFMDQVEYLLNLLLKVLESSLGDQFVLLQNQLVIVIFYLNLQVLEHLLTCLLYTSSGFDFTKRIFTKLDEITAQYPDENILIATHGGTILNTVVNIDHNFVNMDGPANCSITIIDCHGEYRVIEYNLQVAQQIKNSMIK